MSLSSVRQRVTWGNQAPIELVSSRGAIPPRTVSAPAARVHPNLSQGVPGPMWRRRSLIPIVRGLFRGAPT